MKTKSKSLFLTTIISLAMVFSMMFGIMPNNLKSVYASGVEETVPAITHIGTSSVDQETNMGGAPTVMIGQPYSTQVVATGGELTYSAGAGEYMKLPEGLSIDSETGLISGTCTETEIGRFNVYIEVSNNAGKAHAVVGMWVVDNSIVPVIETEAGQLGEAVVVNSFASFQVTVSNEADLMNDLQWSVKEGSLPNGMNLNYAKTKTVYIQGEPTQSGTFEFTLRVENGVGSAERTFRIVVQEGIVQPRIIDYNELPYAIVGKPYEYQLRASGTNTQSNPIVWSYNDTEYSQTSYDLGNGLTLSNTGLISGTPTESGQPYFDYIYAKNSAGSDYQSAYIIVYDNGYVTSIVVSPAETVVEKGGSFQFTAEVFGYGDVSQTIESWDNSMYHQPSSGWFPRPTSEDTKVVNGLLTVGEDETREQIMVVAIVGTVKGYAMVTIAEKGTATHSITFDSNEGTGSMSNLQYIDGYEYTLPTCTFTAPTGKQFKCWSVGGQEKAVGDTITLNADVTIVAIWEDIPVPTSLTATYTGTILAGTTINPSGISITLNYSDSSTEPVNAIDVQYWYGGQQITNPVAYVFGAELIGNLNITIKYEGLETTMAVQIVGHAITFNANGGTGEMAATEYVGAYTLPANGFTAPTGKQFKGWSTSANGNVIEGTTINITADTELFAIWEDIPATPTSLTATYTGTILAGTTINPSGISITLTYSDDSTEPVNAGNVEYWYNGQQITNPVAYVFGVELIGNLNITIKYEGLETTMAVQIVGHAITFNANGGTGEMTATEYVGAYTLPANEFTAPTGKQFKGWSLTNNGEVIQAATYNVTEPITLYAIWEDIPATPSSLTATYTGTILAGTTINPSGILITLNYSDSSTEPVNAIDVEYWYGGQQITNPIAYVFGVELIGNLNITIKYEGLETTMAVQIVGHAITFNANGGTGEMAATEYVGAYTLPANGFTAPTGQQFKGWSLTNNGEVIQAATYNVTEPITLYAIWEDMPVVNYTISFNANNGTGTMQNVEYAGTYTLPACTFTAPTGKQFKGWATSANGNVIEGTTINITADTELFAIWEDVESPQPPINPNPEQPEDTNKGLGAGAIIGIVLASLVVLGTGVFALVWFVIKKKSWADFVAIFKKK